MVREKNLKAEEINTFLTPLKVQKRRRTLLWTVKKRREINDAKRPTRLEERASITNGKRKTHFRTEAFEERQRLIIVPTVS
ncbi:hypothetical protein TNCV_4212061 [Trichonephila clavipes]|nr:hypothetical protein TNCV_4212061 [Trichonephila clavipes]